MLKPYVCVACEKVIQDQAQLPAPNQVGPPSLSNLFTKLLVEVPNGVEIPSNAVGPKEWAIFSMWDAEPGDENKSYILCTAVSYPDGSQFGPTSKTRIPITLGQRSQMVIRALGFPLGQQGVYTVHVWLELENERVGNEIYFGIEVQHLVQVPA
jgi:hypothetical protein